MGISSRSFHTRNKNFILLLFILDLTDNKIDDNGQKSFVLCVSLFSRILSHNQ